ncbi:MAG: prepilin-type N-terminal cleavage/methylation domain-containing protein [Tepidisphaeraceae bacterium]|jgi:prepilin-type N-terminal cleavage/methylation domain-containing protein/prepilin-type processing-associated H-X9-DG protein
MGFARKAFTLVELLVVIGIIGVLIGILLPALSRARQQSQTIVCTSNLRSIGQGITEYIDDYRGVFPPSNYYKGLSWDSQGRQLPTEPSSGYVHWSAFLYSEKNLFGTDSIYYSRQGWDMFTCPALLNGGLPPANTYPGNNDAGLANETTNPDGSLCVDWQAPRCAYSVNEALCPRGIFEIPFDNRQNVRMYKFVQASRVQDSVNTIMATEIWGTQAVIEANPLTSGPASSASTPYVSGSRRPINGISPFSVTGGAQYAYQLLYTKNFIWASVGNLTHDPEDNPSGPNTLCELDWVGRNHGSKKMGSVGGASGSDWDLRKSNFLYVDGHVETKHVTETVYPRNQWGPDFYTLDK